MHTVGYSAQVKRIAATAPVQHPPPRRRVPCAEQRPDVRLRQRFQPEPVDRREPALDRLAQGQRRLPRPVGEHDQHGRPRWMPQQGGHQVHCAVVRVMQIVEQQSQAR